MQTISNIDELTQLLLNNPHVVVRAGGTKSALSKTATVDLSPMAGILQYDPSEYTFTAFAGTRLSEIETALLQHNQFLPFDPPFVKAGATLGGTVAAGLSGPGRMRYGGVRDFLLGVKMVTRKGRVVFGGGKVVKNAAGFDIPKLMVGSQGKFGVFAELTFKVFPRPPRYTTLSIDVDNLDSTIQTLLNIARRPLDLTCLDLEPPHRIWIRFGGSEDALESRIDRIRNDVQGLTTVHLDDDPIWNSINEFDWISNEYGILKIPIRPTRIRYVEECIESIHPQIPRRYSVGGNVVWVGWPTGESDEKISTLCQAAQSKGAAIRGDFSRQHFGSVRSSVFEDKISAAFIS